jgi:hypothetical protein
VSASLVTSQTSLQPGVGQVQPEEQSKIQCKIRGGFRSHGGPPKSSILFLNFPLKTMQLLVIPHLYPFMENPGFLAYLGGKDGRRF